MTRCSQSTDSAALTKKPPNAKAQTREVPIFSLTEHSAGIRLG